MSTTTARPLGRAHAGLGPSRFELDGGALALLESSHDVPLVTIVVALRCGSAGDPPGKSGLSRIAVRMLRRGCEALTSEQIDFRIDSLGAEMAVDTSHSNVAIHAQVIARNLDAFVELLSRLLSTATFPEDELARLQRESVAEIVESRDNDRVVAQKAMQRTLFEGHPYGRSSGGTVPSVQAITVDDVKAFYRRFVVRKNIVIGLAGDVTAARAPAIAARLVAALPEGQRAPDAVEEPTMRPGRRLLVVDKPERTQTQILVGTLGTSPHDEDHVSLVVGNAVFGGTFTSRLMKEIRSKRGLVVRSQRSNGRGPPAAVVGALDLPGRDGRGDPASSCRSICSTRGSRAGSRRGRWPSSSATSYGRTPSRSTPRPSVCTRLSTSSACRCPPTTSAAGSIGSARSRPKAASAAVKNRIHPDDLLVVVVGTAAQVLDPLRSAIPGLAEVSVVPFDAE